LDAAGLLFGFPAIEEKSAEKFAIVAAVRTFEQPACDEALGTTTNRSFAGPAGKPRALGS